MAAHHNEGGAGGFHGSSRAEAEEFTKQTLDAIIKETQADLLVVSCITCLMHLDNVQEDLNMCEGSTNGDGPRYAIPVLDYNQILALCMGFPPEQVAAIAKIPREPLIDRYFRQASPHAVTVMTMLPRRFAGRGGACYSPFA